MTLELRQVGHVPSATKSLDQEYACIHLPAHDVDVVSLVGQRGRLRGHDLQIGVEAAHISVVEYLLCRLRRQSGFVLVGSLLGEHAQRDKIILYLLKRGQRRLPLVGDGLIVAGIGLLRDRSPPPRIEDRLRQRRP